jgi:hypothetical protein
MKPQNNEITTIEVLALMALIFLSLTFKTNKNNENQSKSNQNSPSRQENSSKLFTKTTSKFSVPSANVKHYY